MYRYVAISVLYLLDETTTPYILMTGVHNHDVGSSLAMYAIEMLVPCVSLVVSIFLVILKMGEYEKKAEDA